MRIIEILSASINIVAFYLGCWILSMISLEELRREYLMLIREETRVLNG